MSKLRLAIAGPAGSGKTYSALLIAFGLMADPDANGSLRACPVKFPKGSREAAFNRVAMIDTERGSGELYAHLGEYDVCSITSPFEPEKYTTAIRAAEDGGYGVIIIDSLSHAWTGEGGLLDLHGHLADRSGNSWAAWRKVTPKHNQLVEAMLQSPCHIIATMRSKMEYAQVTENGKTVVKKLGMNPIQRDGMEYEFTLFMDLDLDHVATASKDRTTLFDGKFFKPSTETGRILIKWLREGEIPEIQGKQLEITNQGEGGKEETEGHTTKSETGGPRPADASGPEGNGSRILFAKLGSYGLNKDAYKAYCYSKYNIHSMKQLTAAQREEQIKILNSLKNPERLEEFKKVLGDNGQKTAKESSPPAKPKQEQERGNGNENEKSAPVQPPVHNGLRPGGEFNLF
jgi:hypothetical protein